MTGLGILWAEGPELGNQILLKVLTCLVCTPVGILGCRQVCLGKDCLLSKTPTLALRHGASREREDTRVCARETSFKKEESSACLALGALILIFELVP
jgi:hypothetical protein